MTPTLTLDVRIDRDYLCVIRIYTNPTPSTPQVSLLGGMREDRTLLQRPRPSVLPCPTLIGLGPLPVGRRLLPDPVQEASEGKGDMGGGTRRRSQGRVSRFRKVQYLRRRDRSLRVESEKRRWKGRGVSVLRVVSELEARGSKVGWRPTDQRETR